jgi:hypothetical protein
MTTTNQIKLFQAKPQVQPVPENELSNFTFIQLFFVSLCALLLRISCQNVRYRSVKVVWGTSLIYQQTLHPKLASNTICNRPIAGKNADQGRAIPQRSMTSSLIRKSCNHAIHQTKHIIQHQIFQQVRQQGRNNQFSLFDYSFFSKKKKNAQQQHFLQNLIQHSQHIHRLLSRNCSK